MWPVNHAKKASTDTDRDATVRGEPAAEPAGGQPPTTDDRRQEARLDLDEQTPEEAGYGYGV